MKIWGIDPGATGALALFDPIKGDLDIFDMPIVIVNKKKRVEPALVAQILSKEVKGRVFIEKVGAMPNQGVASMFSFGQSYGVMLGAAAALKLPTTAVTPRLWMKAVNRQIGNSKAQRANKDASRARACQLFPNYAHYFERKKDDGRADAALLCYYGFLYGGSVESYD